MSRFNTGEIVEAICSVSERGVRQGVRYTAIDNRYVNGEQMFQSVETGMYVSCCPSVMMLFDNAVMSVNLDGNFNIKSGSLNHDEQEDFYTALQKWEPISKGTSDIPWMQEDQATQQQLPDTSPPRRHQLGFDMQSRTQHGLRDEWSNFVEQTSGDTHRRMQVSDLQLSIDSLVINQHPDLHDESIPSNDVVRSGGYRGTTGTVEGTQWGGYHNLNLRFSDRERSSLRQVRAEEAGVSGTRSEWQGD